MKKFLVLIVFIGVFAAGCVSIPTYPVPATLDVGQVIAATANPELTRVANENEQLAVAMAAEQPLITPIVELPTPVVFEEIFERKKDIALLLGVLSAGPGSEFYPTEQFHVTWRIRNIGETVWNDEFSIVYAGGESYGQDEPIPLSVEVNPGDIIDLTLVLTAPEELGEYQGEWLLMAPDGEPFGVGYDELKSLHVDINVVKDPIVSHYRMIYQFYSGYTTALWSDQFGPAFSSAQGNIGVYGSVYRDSGVIFEGAIEEDEPTIVMMPAEGEGGYIQGIFPSYIAGPGDYLSTRVGCLEDNHRCDVNLQILVQVVGENEPEIFWEGTKKFDGEWIKLHKPLAKYADKEIQIIFRVENNGDASGDVIGWFVPVIYR